MEDAHLVKLTAQRFHKRLRQYRAPVLTPLAVTNRDFQPHEIDILDTQPHRLHQTQAGTVQQGCYQMVDPIQLSEQITDFRLGQNDRQTRRLFGSRDTVQPRQLNGQHLLVQKQDRRQRLILSRRRYLPDNSKMRQKRLGFIAPIFTGWRLP